MGPGELSSAGKFNIYLIPPFLSLMAGMVIIYIALVKSRFRSENVIFVILCIWWSLLSPVFLCHQFFRGDEKLILLIERGVHFFYVYTPVISLIYFFRVTGSGSKLLVRTSLVISFIISLTTPTELYMPGLNSYSWGYMGKGGPAFIAFGIYAGTVLLYLIVFFIRRMIVESNRLIRLKLKYILASFLISALLSILNYPAIVGIDFYPPGNFSFIPLTFLAYGVLRYRLLDFSEIFQAATLWAILSTFLTIPNIAALYFFYPYIRRESYGILFIAGLIWFFINYHYFSILHTLVERIFNRRKLELQQVELQFMETVYTLRTYDELAELVTGVIKDALRFNRGELVICSAGDGVIPGFDSGGLNLSPLIKKRLLASNGFIEYDTLDLNGMPDHERSELQGVFDDYGRGCIVPLVQHGSIIALLVLSERVNKTQLTPDEARFLKNVKSYASVSLANSIMYSDLTDLKEGLDSKVREKTEDLERSMTALQGVVDSLGRETRDNVISYFTKKKIEEAVLYIENNYSEEITRDTLAKTMNMNSDYLGRIFKKITGKNVSDYINECRLKKACELLINTDDNIVDIAFSVGFESLPTFYRVFKKVMDETPVNYRSKYTVNPLSN